MDRQVWRSALEAGKYELLSSESGGAEPMEVDSPAHLRAKDSSVRLLSQALSHIELGIERRFLKAPLGEEDFKKDQKTKKNKKKDEDQASEVTVVVSVRQCWSDGESLCSPAPVCLRCLCTCPLWSAASSGLDPSSTLAAESADAKETETTCCCVTAVIEGTTHTA
ncbi:hypothetical protein JOQ06_000766 [Pogonophryne albipinna]|uniref:Uncharacterized protein n=1 Tax=Pogonophryne albipinna TaxID=1090488 RepID=A0AAD6A6Q6_9TELE|nr:hypothetical protein JOQ06_000766 [Pogonophryne albipinna]